MIWEKFKLLFKISAYSLYENQNSSYPKQDIDPGYDKIEKIEKIIMRLKEEYGIPGVVVGVNVNGRHIFSKGYGYSDIENSVPCTTNTVMRIASISKPITMTLLAKLLELKALSLDVPIESYISKFPDKYFDNEKVVINLRNIVSHLSGIRHYDKDCKEIKHIKKEKKDKENNSNATKEFELMEYYLSTPYKSISEAMEIFQNDPLCVNPNSQFLYTTHGWTLIAAAIEYATKEPFVKTLQNFFGTMGMGSSYIDENSPLVPYRSRYYVREKASPNSSNYVIRNAKNVDNSYKWAGGGILSTVPDLLTYGVQMLYCYQNCDTALHGQAIVHAIPGSAPANTPSHNKGYLTCDTMSQLWTPIVRTPYKSPYVSHYGMGWFVHDPSAPSTSDTPYRNPALESTSSPRQSERLSIKDSNHTKDSNSQDSKDPKNSEVPNSEDQKLIDDPEAEVVRASLKVCQTCPGKFYGFHHSGGAVGASSILAIFTKTPGAQKFEGGNGDNSLADNRVDGVQGVIVTILTNLQEVSLTKTAFEIGKLFL